MLFKIVYGVLLIEFCILRNGLSQVVVTTECSNVAESNGVQVAQMCHNSSATSSMFLALDVTAAKSVMSSHPVTECACALNINGGTSVVLTALTNITPTDDCGTEIVITSSQPTGEIHTLQCTTNQNGAIHGTQMSLVLRRNDLNPVNGHNFDYCMILYIESPEPDSQLSLVCSDPVGDVPTTTTTLPPTPTPSPVTPSMTQCYKDLQSYTSVAQMCHASVATGSDYVILDIMAAEWKMEQEGVTRCSCSVSIQGGDEFGFAQATTISPSQTCGTRVGITTNFQPDTTYGLECKSSRTQISGDSATVAFSKEPVAPENGYNYDYCLSIYISNKVGISTSLLTVTCFDPQDRLSTSVPSTRSTSSASQVISSYSTTLSTKLQSSRTSSINTQSISFSKTTGASTIKSKLFSTILTSSSTAVPSTASTLTYPITLSTSPSLTMKPQSSRTSSITSSLPSLSRSTATSTVISMLSTTLPVSLSTSFSSTRSTSSTPPLIASSSSAPITEPQSSETSSISTSTTSLNLINATSMTNSSILSTSLSSDPVSSSVTQMSTSMTYSLITSKHDTQTISSSSITKLLTSSMLSTASAKLSKTLSIIPTTTSEPSSKGTFASPIMPTEIETSKLASIHTNLTSLVSSALTTPMSTTGDLTSVEQTSLTTTLSKSSSAVPSSPSSSWLLTSPSFSSPVQVTSTKQSITPVISKRSSSHQILSSQTIITPASTSSEVTTLDSTTMLSTLTTISPTGSSTLKSSTQLSVSTTAETTDDLTSHSTTEESTSPKNVSLAEETTTSFPLELVVSVPTAVVAVVVFALCIYLTSRKSYDKTVSSPDIPDTGTLESSWFDTVNLRTDENDKRNSPGTGYPGYGSETGFEEDDIVVETLKVSGKNHSNYSTSWGNYSPKASTSGGLGGLHTGLHTAIIEEDDDWSQDVPKNYLANAGTQYIDDGVKSSDRTLVIDNDERENKRLARCEETALAMVQILLENGEEQRSDYTDMPN